MLCLYLLKFNTNTLFILFITGVLHAGIRNMHLNKLCAAIDIPPMSQMTFKSHEKEVGAVIEDVAKESCKEAALLERELTITKAQQIEKLL